MSYQEIARNYPENLVGNTLYIYWKEHNVWYRAKAVKYFESSKKYKILYDDEDFERSSLTNAQFILEDDG